MCQPASLAGATERFTRQQIMNLLDVGVGPMPAFRHLGAAERDGLWGYPGTLPGEPGARPTMGEMCPTARDMPVRSASKNTATSTSLEVRKRPFAADPKRYANCTSGSPSIVSRSGEAMVSTVDMQAPGSVAAASGAAATASPRRRRPIKVGATRDPLLPPAGSPPGGPPGGLQRRTRPSPEAAPLAPASPQQARNSATNAWAWTGSTARSASAIATASATWYPSERDATARP